jgi:pyridoxamine 5'-phosphate oxidase
MQPAYYENFDEIIKKIWLMLDDAVTNRSSQFRIPVFYFAVLKMILMEEL